MGIDKDIAELHNRLESLMKEAHRNDALLKKFQSFELDLMDTESPSELLHKLILDNHVFGDCDEICLMLIDPQEEIRHLLKNSEFDSVELHNLVFIEQGQSLQNIYKDDHHPVLGIFNPSLHDFLFNKTGKPLTTVGLLPLIRNHHLIGSYNLGSCDESRFNQHDATDFLQHLSTVIAVCIENSLSKERLKNLGLVDNLTGVNNRRYFDKKLYEEIIRVRRSGSPVSCLFIDIDHFKRINDQNGHQVGDDVLRHVAQLIKEQVRNIDIVARYGGEEFTVLLLESSKDKAEEVAERIRTIIEGNPYQLKNYNKIQITTSIGYNTLTENECEGDYMDIAKFFIKKADKALYKAKKSGRNCSINAADL